MINIVSPFDQKIIKSHALATTKEMEEAVSTAYKLFDNPSNWIPKHRRRDILENIAFIMEERAEELVHIATLEGGKPLMDTRPEVARAIHGVKLAVEHMGQIKGEEVAMGHTESSTNRLAFTMKEPIGVVASISAFNHPINLIIHQTIPAIAVGAPVIIKPSLSTPLTCLLLMEIYKDAGLPAGWCTPLLCDNNVAEQLASSREINFMSFIGSAKVGWYLRSKLAAGTRCGLEHGGIAPVIVEPDAELSGMSPALVKGGFYHAGQVCVSVQRVYVHDSILWKVLDELKASALKLVVGDPLKEETEIGPLITPQEVDRVDDWVQQAVSEGAELICGGQKIGDTCYSPTILLNPDPQSKVSTAEIFGPVICVYGYKDRMEAIDRANSSKYAFQASIFTKDINVAMDSVKKINATTVMVNDHTAFRVDWMPFGGRDASGLGLGSIPHSMDDMTREKMMVIKSPLL